MSWAEVCQEWLAAGEEYRRATALVLSGLRCFYCDDAAQALDHIVARANGGPDTPENLVPVCRTCNGQKSAKTLEAWAEQIRAEVARVPRKLRQLEAIRRLVAEMEVPFGPRPGTCIHDWQEVTGEPDAYTCTHCHARWVTAA